MTGVKKINKHSTKIRHKRMDLLIRLDIPFHSLVNKSSWVFTIFSIFSLTKNIPAAFESHRTS